MTEELTVESTIAPPALSCPKCNGMLPMKLGDVECALCGAHARVNHPGTRKAWLKEKISCPSCSSVLVAGIDKRPAELKCGSCQSYFMLTRKVPRVEVDCPGCERTLRMRQRPGRRDIECPACATEFAVNF